MSEQPWRVVQDDVRNICLYREDTRVAVVLGGPDLAGVRARELAAVLNEAEALEIDPTAQPAWGLP